MINVYEFGKTGRVQLIGRSAPLAPDLHAKVEALWAEELQRRDYLFNGEILAVGKIEANNVSCSLSEYRYLVAQRLSPDLSSRLQVRALAVSGVLYCQDGLIIGLRSNLNFQSVGLWDLVPTGGIDLSALDSSADGFTFPKEVHYLAQLKSELQEEIGLDWGSIDAHEEVCLVEDTEENLVDIVVRLSALKLTFGDVERIHGKLGSKEYEKLMLLKNEDVQDRQTILSLGLSPVLRLFIERFF